MTFAYGLALDGPDRLVVVGADESNNDFVVARFWL